MTSPFGRQPGTPVSTLRQAGSLAAVLLVLAGSGLSGGAAAAVIPLAGRYADEIRGVPMPSAELSRRPASAALRDPHPKAQHPPQPPSPVVVPQRGR